MVGITVNWLFFNTMTSFGRLAILSLTMIHCVHCCVENGYYLNEENINNKTAVHCSSSLEDISTKTKLLDILSRDYVIGIYKRSATTAQLCYSKVVQNGQVTLDTLSGGSMYMLGEYCQPGRII